ncbi:MAG: DMT family transporter [Candidatus Krumholzibacteria bacterium]|nr:DMT family transporter [Candidatus Krumholzibacteria bacterium]
MKRSFSAAPMTVLLVLVFVIWSNAFTAIKYLREVLSPIQLVLARFLPAAVFCLAYLLAVPSRRKESLAILKRSPFGLIAMGLSGVAGYNFFLFLGQSEVKPGAAALLTTLSPLFTLLGAMVFLKERVPLRRILGILIAFAGLYIVVRWGKVGLGHVTGVSHAELRYILITALAPLCWTIYTILGKKVLGKTSAMTVTYLTIIIGTLPFLGAAGRPFFKAVASLTPLHWAALAYLTVLCTLVGFWIWFAALKSLPATLVASFIYLNPPFAALFGSLLFNEEVTGLFIIGAAVLLFGLWLAQGVKQK